jgi:hypothetical protein
MRRLRVARVLPVLLLLVLGASRCVEPVTVLERRGDGGGDGGPSTGGSSGDGGHGSGGSVGGHGGGNAGGHDGGTCSAPTPDTCGSGAGALCTSIESDSSNCGACGHVCHVVHGTAGCMAGQCVIAACDGGFADCDGIFAGGCSYTPNSDAQNCGICGHSCLGGACLAGRCQPVVVAGDPLHDTGLGHVSSLVVLNGVLYGTSAFGSGGAVFAVPAMPAPGALTWLVQPGGGVGAQALATDGASLFYAISEAGGPEAAGIWNVRLDGSGNTLVVAGGTTSGGACDLPGGGGASAYGDQAGPIALDGGYLYWVRATSSDCAAPWPACRCPGVYRATTDGSGVAVYHAGTSSPAAFGGNYAGDPIADSGTLYFAGRDAHDAGNRVQAVTAAMFAGGAPPTTLTTTGNPSEVATDATHVYWIGSSTTTACGGSTACAPGEHCGAGVCTGTACGTDADCAPGGRQVCVAGVCTVAGWACLTDPDCAAGEQCTSRTCGTGRLYRMAKAGGPADDITPPGFPAGTIGALLVDDTQLFFVSPAPTQSAPAPGTLYVMPSDGSGPAIPIANVSGAGDSFSAWTQEGPALYWATYGPGPPYAVVYKLAK